LSAIASALVDHPRVIIVVLLLALTVLLGVGIYRAGESAQFARDQAAATVAEARTNSAMASALAKLAPLKRENDSLHVRNGSLQVRAAQLDTIVETRRGRARTVNDRLVLHGDTAQVATDSGVVPVTIPEVLTRQLAAMQLNNDSLVIAMGRLHKADSTAALGLAEENSGLRLQIEVDSSIDVDYRKQLAAAEARAASAEVRPKHSAAVAFLGGVVVALAGVVTVVAVF
jgi:hypothetical protein